MLRTSLCLLLLSTNVNAHEVKIYGGRTDTTLYCDQKQCGTSDTEPARSKPKPGKYAPLDERDSYVPAGTLLQGLGVGVPHIIPR